MNRWWAATSTARRVLRACSCRPVASYDLRPLTSSDIRYMLLYQIQTIVPNSEQEPVMTYSVIQDVPANDEIYAKIRAGIGDTAPDGMITHLAMRHAGGLRYVDVWHTEAQYRRFMDETVEPVVTEVLAGYGIPHDHSMVTTEEVEVIDVWLGTPVTPAD